jgi:hypothetical protein
MSLNTKFEELTSHKAGQLLFSAYWKCGVTWGGVHIREHLDTADRNLMQCAGTTLQT